MQKDSSLILRKYFGINNLSISGLNKARKLLSDLELEFVSMISETVDAEIHPFTVSVRKSKSSENIVATLEVFSTEFLPKLKFKRYIKPEKMQM